MLMAESHLRGSHHVSTQTLIVYPPQIDGGFHRLGRTFSLSTHHNSRHGPVLFICHLNREELGHSLQHKTHVLGVNVQFSVQNTIVSIGRDANVGAMISHKQANLEG